MRGSDSATFRLAVCFVLAAAVAAVFWPLFTAEFVNFDDPRYVLRNPHVQGGFTPEALRWAWTAGYAANWHPLTWMSHILDWRLFGDRAGGHHAVSVLLHAANAILLFLFLERLTAAPWRSAAVAALFAVHPLHVESVSWIAERKDLLSTLLGLLTLGAYAAYTRRPSPGRMAAVAALLAAGLCAKPMLVTLPFVMLLLDAWPLARLNRGAAALVVEKLPLLGLVAASCVVTVLVQRLAQATALMNTIGFPLRAANAALSYAAYLCDTIWPANLAVFYPHPGKGLSVAAAAAAAAALAVCTAAVVARRRKQPYLLFGWLWFIGTLVPVIGLVQVGGQARADRYTYLPLVGIFVAAVWGCADALDALARRRGAPTAPDSAARLWPVLAVLPVLAVAARAQAGTWTDSVALWTHALSAVPPNAGAHTNLGNALAERGKKEEAERQYREALRLSPQDADAAKGLGLLLLDGEKTEDALALLQKAVDSRPWFAAAHADLAAALSRIGRQEEALRHAATAVRLEPELPEAHGNLGVLLLRSGRVEDAIRELETACRLDPASSDARNNLGAALLRAGRPGEALTVLKRAVALRADDPKSRDNLGQAYAATRSPAEAAIEFETSLRLDPHFVEARNHLGMVLVDLGRVDEAVGHYEKALEAEPDFLEALNNLGGALLLQGRLGDAEARLRRALQLKPTYAKAHANLATALCLGGRYAEAWDEVSLARLNGFEPPARLLAELSAKMPQPSTRPR